MVVMVNVDIIAGNSGGLEIQVDWLCPKAASHLALVCNHQLNWLNSYNGWAMKIA